MHGDDYSLNTKLHYCLVTCAISYARAVSLLTLLGMCAPSETDHYAFKGELEPILANMAERSMAEAHGEHVARGDTATPRSTVASPRLATRPAARWPHT